MRKSLLQMAVAATACVALPGPAQAAPAETRVQTKTNPYSYAMAESRPTPGQAFAYTDSSIHGHHLRLALSATCFTLPCEGAANEGVASVTDTFRVGRSGAADVEVRVDVHSVGGETAGVSRADRVAGLQVQLVQGPTTTLCDTTGAGAAGEYVLSCAATDLEPARGSKKENLLVHVLLYGDIAQDIPLGSPSTLNATASVKSIPVVS